MFLIELLDLDAADAELIADDIDGMIHREFKGVYEKAAFEQVDGALRPNAFLVYSLILSGVGVVSSLVVEALKQRQTPISVLAEYAPFKGRSIRSASINPKSISAALKRCIGNKPAVNAFISERIRLVSTRFETMVENGTLPSRKVVEVSGVICRLNSKAGLAKPKFVKGDVRQLMLLEAFLEGHISPDAIMMVLGDSATPPRRVRSGFGRRVVRWGLRTATFGTFAVFFPGQDDDDGLEI